MLGVFWCGEGTIEEQKQKGKWVTKECCSVPGLCIESTLDVLGDAVKMCIAVNYFNYWSVFLWMCHWTVDGKVALSFYLGCMVVTTWKGLRFLFPRKGWFFGSDVHLKQCRAVIPGDIHC